MATVYESFDPALSLLTTLSAGNLTATRNSSSLTPGGAMGFAVGAKSSGKIYFEFGGLNSVGAATACGICLSGTADYFDLQNNGLDGAIVFNSLNLWINGTNTGHIDGTGGLTYQFAVDFTNHLIWARVNSTLDWNNSGSADPASGVGGRTIQSGSFVPVWTNGESGVTTSDTVNLITNPADFAGSLPAGFAPWVVPILSPNTYAQVIG